MLFSLSYRMKEKDRDKKGGNEEKRKMEGIKIGKKYSL